jgi:hypothetical protein
VTIVGADGSGNSSPPQSFTIGISKPYPWHNQALLVTPLIGALDVDADGFIAPADALAVINYINAFGNAVPAGALIGGPNGMTPGRISWLDTGGGEGGTGDNFISPLDALNVINWINAFGRSVSAGEGEEGLVQPLGAPAVSTLSADEYFFDLGRATATTHSRTCSESDLLDLTALLVAEDVQKITSRGKSPPRL